MVRSAVNSAVPLLAFVTLCALLNAGFSHAVLSLFVGGTPLGSVVFLAAVGVLGFKVSYSEVPYPVAIVIRITLSFCVFYLVTSRMSLPDDLFGTRWDIGVLLNYAWILAVAFGLAGLVRPSFGLIALHYMHFQKQAVAFVFGVPITSADYMTIIDTVGLLILASLVYRPFCSLWEKCGFSGIRQPNERRLGLMEAVFMAAVALHFGNYFYGALGKLALGDSPLYWVLQNKTEYLVLTSRETGVNPLTFSDGFVKTMYEWFAYSSPLFNFATVAGQAVCVILIVRPRLAMLTTAFFDLMHIGIFVFTGIFFWKFILLNLAIVLGLRRMLDRTIPTLFAAYLVLLVVVSPALFHINYFFWLDTRSMNSVKIWAVDDDGREFRVPASYFRAFSVTMNQHRLVYPEHGPYPTWTWGTTRSRADVDASETCELERMAEGGQPNRYFVERDRIERAVRKYHRVVADQVSDTGNLTYDLYPHHMFSVPWEFDDFRYLDKRRIAKYRYTIEAICLGYEDRQFTRQVFWSDGFDIEIDRQ